MSPHVLWGQLGGAGSVLAVLLDGIVGQVDGLVKVIQCVLLGAEPQVRVLVEPQRQWVPVCHQEPLADVELSIVDQQGALWENDGTMTPQGISSEGKTI